MYRVVEAVKSIMSALIFLIPIFLIYGKYVFHGVRKSISYLVFAMYLAAVYSLVGLPNILYLRFDFTHNFIPFIGLTDSITESILNVLLFVPMGILLPMLCEKFYKFKYTVFFGAITTIGIEILQIFTYRATDINDIITNILGTVIGYFIAAIITVKFSRMTLKEKSARGIYLVFTTAFGVMFLLVPFISRAFGGF